MESLGSSARFKYDRGASGGRQVQLKNMLRA